PTVTLPKDFMSFWKSQLKDAREVPLDITMDKIESRSTSTVDVYEISYQNTKDSRIYGALAIPKKDGKYPVVLRVPGAGVRRYLGDRSLADKGFIVLQIGIHGVSISQPKEFYKELLRTRLKGYYPHFDVDD